MKNSKMLKCYPNGVPEISTHSNVQTRGKSGKPTNSEVAEDTGFPLFIHSFIHFWGKGTHVRALVEVKRQLSESASLLPLWELQRSNSGHQA